MNFSLRYQVTLLATVVLSMASFASGAGLTPLSLVLGTLAWAGWEVTRKGTRRVLPGWALYAIVSAALVAAGWRAFSESRAVGAFGGFLCVAVLARLWDKRAPKDDSQVLMLCAFLLIGSMLQDQSLAVGLHLVLAVPLLVYAALMQQTSAAHFRVRTSGAMLEEASQVNPARGLLSVAAASMAVGLIVTGAVFVLMPRELGRSMLMRLKSGGTVTGFSTDIRLGRSGILSQSTTHVLDLTVRDAGGRNLGADARGFYLRGTTWDTYTPGGKWARSPSAPQIETVGPGIRKNVGASVRAGPSTLHQEILIRRGSPRLPIFTIWRPFEIEFDQRGDIEESVNDLTLVRSVSMDGPQMVRYRVASDPNLASGFVGERATGVTYESPPIQELTQRLLRDGGVEPDPAKRPFEDDADAARVIERHFRDQFRYTLEMEPPVRGQDPIEDFLFRRKAGHCEYFASAMTVMLRSVGINARMVGGYLALEFNDATGAYTVRESNAHAWVEVEVGAGNWRQFDPTPPAELREVHQPEQSLFAWAGRLLDTLEYAWIDAIVTFDEASRMRVMGDEATRHTLGDRLVNGFEARLREGGRELLRDAAINGGAAFGVVLLLGLLIRQLVRRVGRRVIVHAVTLRTKDPVAHAQIGFLRIREALRLAGAEVDAHQPIRAGVMQLTASVPVHIRVAAARATDKLYRICFGAGEASSQLIADADRDVVELEAACRSLRRP